MRVTTCPATVSVPLRGLVASLAVTWYATTPEPVPAAPLATGSPRAAVLQALAVRVATALPGLRGFVGIDLVWNERDGPVVIEVNPRVTCAYCGLSALLQRNLAADVLAPVFMAAVIVIICQSPAGPDGLRAPGL